MMGGRTKIGIGRTTRVKAVSVIAWGKRREHCAHASFQILQWVGFNFLFHEIRWVLGDRSWAGNDAFSHYQPPSHLQFTEKHVYDINKFGAVNEQARWVCKKATHMSCSNFGGAHHIPIVVQHINTFRLLIVSHQAHVTNVCTSWG